MTTIDQLARTIADTHGIDSLAAARESVTVLVNQIADDADLWDADSDALTPAGVEVVTQAVAESYAIGAVATQAQILLTDIEEAAAKLDELDRTRQELTERRDQLIRSALGTELRRADIAAAARIKEARLYQIRDGRR